jgi:spore germination cell wall hydrolase CwlJ-like protein
MIEAAIMCLALNIYFEARDQPINGQIAVAEVTLNRVTSKNHPNTICKVVKQSSSKGCAFSWYCDGQSDIPREKIAFERSKRLSEFMIDNHKYISVVGEKATYYHNDTVNPYWAKGFHKLKKVGDHTFYSRYFWLKKPMKKPKIIDKIDKNL